MSVPKPNLAVESTWFNHHKPVEPTTFGFKMVTNAINEFSFRGTSAIARPPNFLAAAPQRRQFMLSLAKCRLPTCTVVANLRFRYSADRL